MSNSFENSGNFGFENLGNFGFGNSGIFAFENPIAFEVRVDRGRGAWRVAEDT